VTLTPTGRAFEGQGTHTPHTVHRSAPHTACPRPVHTHTHTHNGEGAGEMAARWCTRCARAPHDEDGAARTTSRREACHASRGHTQSIRRDDGSAHKCPDERNCLPPVLAVCSVGICDDGVRWMTGALHNYTRVCAPENYTRFVCNACVMALHTIHTSLMLLVH
jgi:hypothetical protein